MKLSVINKLFCTYSITYVQGRMVLKDTPTWIFAEFRMLLTQRLKTIKTIWKGGTKFAIIAQKC